MRVFLMHADSDFNLDTPAPAQAAHLENDLELETLLQAMAAGDKLVYGMARKALFAILDEPEAIRHRQHVLRDCIRNETVVRELYALAGEALEKERKVGWYWSKGSPTFVLRTAVAVLESHLDILRRLRQLADSTAREFKSPGFNRFFATIDDELSDDYLDSVEGHLDALRFKGGLLASVRLGSGNRGRAYVVRRHREQTWSERLAFTRSDRGLSFTIPERDEGGFRSLDEIRGRAINELADTTAQAADHVTSFLRMLQAELAFYLGCVNLHSWLSEHDQPVCFPDPLADGVELRAHALGDPCLALQLDRSVVVNDIDSDRPLMMITGANQGGKSTFLRSIGLGFLMMQSGMIVCAREFRASVCMALFTHYKREEDETMEGGKLDEELARISGVADFISPGSILLCNESFASTNEREGSEIARQIVRALLDKRIRVAFVTHMFDLAHGFEADPGLALFLRADRGEDGARSYKITPGRPLPTSYGEDTFRIVFATAPGRSPKLIASTRIGVYGQSRPGGRPNCCCPAKRSTARNHASCSNPRGS
jgi:hypothetical protein